MTSSFLSDIALTIISVLLFVSSISLTITGLSSFYSLNPCLTTIFLSINILVVLLSKSTFTVMLLCVFTFSISIFSYTSFNILNVLFTSLCLLFSLVTLFRTSIYILLYYNFSCSRHAATF